MNTPGKKDGIIRSWLDGEKTLEITTLRFRDVADLKIDKFEFETFFGGGDASWATPRDQYATFDNFVIAKNPIGPNKDFLAKAVSTSATVTSNGGGKTGTLVFDGDHPAWVTSNWSEGNYDFQSKAQNHTPGGTQSVKVMLPNGGWGAVQFEGPTFKPADFHSLSFWVYPTGCDVEFRVRFEYAGSQVGIEKPITGAKGWAVNEWNLVRVDLEDFKIPDSFNKIVLDSNSAKAVLPFYVDDVVLEK